MRTHSACPIKQYQAPITDILNGQTLIHLLHVKNVVQKDAPSSRANKTPPIGVWNAAATPAAVPIAARSRLEGVLWQTNSYKQQKGFYVPGTAVETTVSTLNKNKKPGHWSSLDWSISLLRKDVFHTKFSITTP